MRCQKIYWMTIHRMNCSKADLRAWMRSLTLPLRRSPSTDLQVKNPHVTRSHSFGGALSRKMKEIATACATEYCYHTTIRTTGQSRTI